MHTFHFIYLGSLHYYDNVNQCRCCHQIIVIMVDLSIFYYYMEMNEKNRNNALFMWLKFLLTFKTRSFAPSFKFMIS